jgi:hypothetical protein
MTDLTLARSEDGSKEIGRLKHTPINTGKKP